ncbi:MAG: GTPase ObgE [Dehalococcoidales bacterium]
MFDKVEIKVRSGDGGDGSVSFRREKFIPFGGPDGGDGGNGGNVIILADPGTDGLQQYKHRGTYKAAKGVNGRGQKKHGKTGKDLVIKVPMGTLALDANLPAGEALVADCDQPGQQVMVVRGGKGGLGNTRFASSTNQAPRIAQKGDPGEELSLILELMLIADVGITGYPNAGKSTLLATASAAKPKIASYPFTTLEPVLGVVEVGLKSFVMADIPGLIDGAHLGRGLGHDFLRHIMRTKILVHLIDGSSESPVDDMIQVNEELGLFDPVLIKKPQLVVVNKIDLPQVGDRLADIRQAFRDVGTPVVLISAATGDGVQALMKETLKLLDTTGTGFEEGKKVHRAIFRPQPRGAPATIIKDGDTFVIESHELERMVSRVDMSNPEVYRQMQWQLGKLGVNKAMQKAGAEPGDKVRCGQIEWEW